MNIRHLSLATALCLGSCISVYGQKHHVISAERSLIQIDQRYANDEEAERFLAPYKHIVDSVMAPVVGNSARFMKSHRPESELSNLLADIMVWCGKRYGESPDMGIYNMGGIRAALPQGTVTFGDINDIAPFENKICFLTLTGEQLTKLFRQIGHTFGAAVSRGTKAVYQGKELMSLTLHGEPIEPAKKYRIATIDYLIQGNDGFREFRNATDLRLIKEHDANTRYLIADYFREKMAAGEPVDSKIEGRMEELTK